MVVRRKKAKKTTKRKVKKKRKAPKNAFGGIKIKPDVKLGAVIGKGAVSPAQMTKKVWVYIKGHHLMKR